MALPSMITNTKLIVGLILLALTMISTGSLVNKATYILVFDENHLVESLTVALYLAASILAFYALVVGITRKGISEHSAILAALIIFSLFLVLEELSLSVWSVFNGTEPPRILGIRMDAIHDFFHLSVKALELLLASNFLLGFAAFCTIVTTLLLLAKLQFHTYLFRKLNDTLNSRAATFVLVFILFGIAALLADLRSGTWPVLLSVEESFEFCASVSYVIATYFTVRENQL